MTFSCYINFSIFDIFLSLYIEWCVSGFTESHWRLDRLQKLLFLTQIWFPVVYRTLTVDVSWETSFRGFFGTEIRKLLIYIYFFWLINYWLIIFNISDNRKIKWSQYIFLNLYTVLFGVCLAQKLGFFFFHSVTDYFFILVISKNHIILFYIKLFWHRN